MIRREPGAIARLPVRQKLYCEAHPGAADPVTAGSGESCASAQEGGAASGSRKADAQQSLTGLTFARFQRLAAAIRCDNEGRIIRSPCFCKASPGACQPRQDRIPPALAIASLFPIRAREKSRPEYVIQERLRYKAAENRLEARPARRASAPERLPQIRGACWRRAYWRRSGNVLGQAQGDVSPVYSFSPRLYPIKPYFNRRHGLVSRPDASYNPQGNRKKTSVQRHHPCAYVSSAPRSRSPAASCG